MESSCYPAIGKAESTEAPTIRRLAVWEHPSWTWGDAWGPLDPGHGVHGFEVSHKAARGSEVPDATVTVGATQGWSNADDDRLTLLQRS